MHIEKSAPGSARPGRARVNEEGGTLRITIHRKWDLFKGIIFSFLCIWLAGWAFGEFVVVSSLARHSYIAPASGGADVYIWLAAWSIGGIGVLGFTIWFFFSREIITAAPDSLSIESKVLGLGIAKRYAVSGVNNLRLIKPEAFGGGFSLLSYPRMDRGLLAFDYGMRTVQFIRDIEEIEAEQILNLIRQKISSRE
jgi:hypothetical protein